MPSARKPFTLYLPSDSLLDCWSENATHKSNMIRVLFSLSDRYVLRLMLYSGGQREVAAHHWTGTPKTRARDVQISDFGKLAGRVEFR